MVTSIRAAEAAAAARARAASQARLEAQAAAIRAQQARAAEQRAQQARAEAEARSAAQRAAQAAANRAYAARQEAMTTSQRGTVQTSNPPQNPTSPRYSPPVIQPTPPYVPPPPPPPVSPGNQSIKIATAELFISGESTVSEEQMFARTISDVASLELLELTRQGAVDGIDQTYLPITGLADLNMQNDPTKIIALQNSSDEYFKQFSIPLERYTPSEGTGENGEIVYIDTDSSSPTYNSLVINMINLKPTERLEIEFIYFDSASNVKWYN